MKTPKKAIENGINNCPSNCLCSNKINIDYKVILWTANYTVKINYFNNLVCILNSWIVMESGVYVNYSLYNWFACTTY